MNYNLHRLGTDTGLIGDISGLGEASVLSNSQPYAQVIGSLMKSIPSMISMSTPDSTMSALDYSGQQMVGAQIAQEKQTTQQGVSVAMSVIISILTALLAA